MPISDLPKIRVGVGVFLQNAEGQVLLEKRRDCGLWCVPGGYLEAGETVTQTAIREVLEETGLNIHVAGMVGVYSDPKDRVVNYPDTGRSRLIDIVVRGKIVDGKLACSEESFEIAFFNKNALPPILPRSLMPIQDGFDSEISNVC